ncbi:MAG: hypothetical protein RSA10_01700 [Bacilli bacterium]
MESAKQLLVLVLAIILIIFLAIFIFKTGKKLFNIFLMVIILLFSWFSFFTVTGSVRLAIALTGHPIAAYTTKLTENELMREKNARYFLPDQDIKVTSGSMGYIRCETKWIISLSSYYGF